MVADLLDKNSRSSVLVIQTVWPLLTMKGKTMKMLRINQRILLLLLSVFIGTIISGTAALAHGVYCESTELGKVRFFYDDDAGMAFAFVTVYDQVGNEITKGETDRDGMFDYSQYENAAKIVAADTYGHQSEHVLAVTPPENATKPQQNSPMLLGVIVVALLVIAAVFYASGKKKPNDKSAN